MPRPPTYTRALDALFDHSLYRINSALMLLESFGSHHACIKDLDDAIRDAETAGHRAQRRRWRDRQRNASAEEEWRAVGRALRRMAAYERAVSCGRWGEAMARLFEDALPLVKEVRKAVRRQGRMAGEKDWVQQAP